MDNRKISDISNADNEENRDNNPDNDDKRQNQKRSIKLVTFRTRLSSSSGNVNDRFALYGNSGYLYLH